MFMETVRVSTLAKSSDAESSDGMGDPGAISIPTHLPLPNNFEDETATQLRAALLVSVASIKAGNGCTPDDIIDELLNFAENNDNSPKVEEGSSADDGGRTFDDALYCATLLYCLSKIVSGNAGTLERVIDCAKYYADRERIVTSSLYEVDSNLTKGLYKNEEDILMSGNGTNGRRKFSVGKSGIVTAMALQCICNMEGQLYTVAKAVESKERHDSSSTSQKQKAHTVFNYDMYIYSHSGSRNANASNPLVRASALDCRIRLAFSKHTARVLDQAAHDSSTSNLPRKTATPSSAATDASSAQSYGVKLGRIISDCVDVMLRVIAGDPSRDVRRCAAMSFLFAIQVCTIACNN